MKKVVLAGIVTSLLVASSCWAAEKDFNKERPQGRPEVTAAQGFHGRPAMRPGMRRPQMTKEQALEKLGKEYGYSETELTPFVESGRDYRKMSSNCLLARLSGAPLAEVVELGSKMTSGRVRYKLGLTPKIYFEKLTAWQAARLATQLALPEGELVKLLRANYSESEIRMAAALGTKAKKSIKQVLKLKTAANTWEMLAGKLDVDASSFEAIKKEVKPMPDGPRRSGAGFAGIHMRNPSNAYLLKILNRDYGFSVAEMSPLLEKLGFQELEQLCLYAHFANKPLAKVVPLREKYTWEGMKLALGLDAEKFTKAAIKFHARRIYERQEVPVKITEKLMAEGYSLHHINTAYKYSLKCGKSVEEIIALKTPGKRWDVVAEECGIPQEYANKVKKSITDTMGRYGN